MRSRRIERRVLVPAAATLALLIALPLTGACGVGVVGDTQDPAGPDGATDPRFGSVDGAIPLPPRESGGPGDSPGFRCGETTLASCLECNTGHFLCQSTGECVASCKTSCGAEQVECVGCTPGSVVGSAICAAPGQACSADRCPCVTETDCREPRQICSGGVCLACGEPGSHDFACQGGGRCDDDGKGKVEDNQTCR